MTGDIIIKKVKKSGHAAHGGAWKVAYADFVTAMMAFFLLLWLLSAASEETLKGISDYFTPTIGLKDSEGIGADGGQSPMDEGTKKGEWTNDAVMAGAPMDGPLVEVPESAEQKEEVEEAENFARLERDLDKAIHENPELRQFKENILIEQTPEGLKIQVAEMHKKPMFMPGGSELTPFAKKIFSKITSLIRFMPNYISVTGHTDSSGGRAIAGRKGNWELSVSRANATRRFMEDAKLDPERTAKVIGKADFEPFDKEDLESPKNRRIEIILLKNTIVPYHKKAAPEKFLSEESKEGGPKLEDSAEPILGNSAVPADMGSMFEEEEEEVDFDF